MKKPKEPMARTAHRFTCKHYSYGICIKQSGFVGPGVHITIGCTPNSNCRRMKIYDTKNGLGSVEYQDNVD